MTIKHLQIPALIFTLATLFTSLLPSGPTNPSPVSAGPGVMKWDTVNTPNSDAQRNDVLNPFFGGNFTGSEVRDLAVGGDGNTLLAAVTVNGPASGLGALPQQGVLFNSGNGGITWSTAAHRNLLASGMAAANHVYNVFIAPDDPKMWMVTVGGAAPGAGPTQLWVTSDGGTTWANAGVPGLAAGEAIVTADISVSYGSGHDILAATRSRTGAGRLFVAKPSNFSNWAQQAQPVATPIDYFAARFSPTYAGDSSVIVVYADDNRTCYNIGLRDINSNSIASWVFTGNGIEVKSSSAADNVSPSFVDLVRANISLPSDFSGQSSSLRRAFVSLCAFNPGTADNQTGIFRIDDNVPASLYSTSSSAIMQIYSIAYFGTYSAGKLLAGQLYGSPCIAAVPTLFTDSPCTCSGSCFGRSLKPPTGAGNQSGCGDNVTGIGAAVVAWNPNGSLAYAVTGSGVTSDNFTWWNDGLSPWISTLIPNDESAFSISRNNGETWNQLALIDTTIDWFNDVAITPDCTTAYLASVHRNIGTGCNEFDSVWRSTINPSVSAPLPAAAPIGLYWERVLCHTTSGSCAVPQSDLPLVRTVTDCNDKSSGAVVAWAAQYGPATASAGGAMAWSPDYGDFWQPITTRNLVQDFTFDSSYTMYVLSPAGMVQKLAYTGTGWSLTLPSTDTTLFSGHTIAAYSSRVLVGAGVLSNAAGLAAAYSADSGQHWFAFKDRMPAEGNVHVIFDVDYVKNSFVYAATDNASGTVYRNTAPSFTRWDGNDMMEISDGAAGPDWWNNGYSQATGDPPHRVGHYGIVMAYTGNPQPALYSAHENITTSLAAAPGAAAPSDSAVCRTLEPRNGMPKPGVYWDCLDIFSPASQTGVHFTLEPCSLKSCGCCTADTNTALWAIDNESRGPAENMLARSGRYLMDPGYNPAARQGMLWAYTDCLAKKGPALKAPLEGALVGADPVTGRSQQIDLSWEQLCLSTVYQLDIAKDSAFTLRVVVSRGALGNQVPSYTAPAGVTNIPGVINAPYQHILVSPADVTRPATWLAPGALPEAGAMYYWRIRSYQSATGQIAVSPFSEVRSFAVKPGFIVNTPYYGVQLLAPDNGCQGCKVKPASFSWSPWKEATLYEFILAQDPEFTSVITKAQTPVTAYEYDGTLDYSTNYFWRVRATEINGQKIPSDWSATFSFSTEPAPPPGALPSGEPVTPIWVWAVIGVGAVLIIIMLVLIIRTRRNL
ncbi:MAG: hypothetical protein PHO26_03145 [Dehalococcoidia bacterium]|nr:hypothetical protein [Dehalococcoidia bacterium]MDD5494606.1 hypothetical protein [Dehalococcoidia bacterium]